MTSMHQITNRLEEHEQNTLKLKAIENKTLILSSAIVELWLSDKPSNSTWSKLACGILCLVKKNKPETFFFQLFDLQANILWQQEIYIPFCYNIVSKNFHYFPAQDQNAGFNFAFSSEADNIIDCIGEYIDKKNTASKQISIENTILPNCVQKNKNLSENIQEEELDNRKMFDQKPSASRQSKKPKENRFNSIFNSQKKKARRFFSFGKIDKPKLDISSPYDFRVVQRVQITGESNKIYAKDEETEQKIKEILSKLNVKSNRKTEKFVGNFLKNNNSEKNPQARDNDTDNHKKHINNESIQSNTGNFVIETNLAISQGQKIDEPWEQQPKNADAATNYFHNESNLLNVLKEELEKRAQFLNQSDSDSFYSDEGSSSDWN